MRPISTAAWPAIWPLTSTSSVGSVKGIRNDGTVLVGRNLTSICGRMRMRVDVSQRSLIRLEGSGAAQKHVHNLPAEVMRFDAWTASVDLRRGIDQAAAQLHGLTHGPRRVPTCCERSRLTGRSAWKLASLAVEALNLNGPQSEQSVPGSHSTCSPAGGTCKGAQSAQMQETSAAFMRSETAI